MRPKVNENTLEQGVVNIIDDTSVFNEEMVYMDDGEKIQYIILVYENDTQEEAKNSFSRNTSDKTRYSIKTNGSIQYGLTESYRYRDWRYFGVSTGCYGDIYVQSEKYIVKIDYLYTENKVEELIGIFFPPESIYREEIDLMSIHRVDTGDNQGTNQGTVL